MKPKYNLRQYAIGSPSNRQRPTEYEPVIDDNATDCYSTWVLYDDSVLKYYDEHGGISGYVGEVPPAIVPIDIDRKDDLDKALNICRDIVRTFVHELDVDERNINIYFSGNKGFHIDLPPNLFDIPPTPLRELCKRLKKIFTQIDRRIDMALYRPNMLYRMGKTKHKESGLFKTPITHEELMTKSILEIQALALTKRNIENLDFYDCTINDTLNVMWLESKEKEEKPHKHHENTVSTTLKLPNGVSEGSRNNTAFDITLNHGNNGLGVDEIKELVLVWNQTNNPPETNISELMKTVDSAYRYVTVTKNLCAQCKRHFRADTFYHHLPNNDYKTMYLHLQSNLNDEEKMWKGIRCKQNQWITTNDTLARECDVTKNQARGFINLLKKHDKIDVTIVEVEVEKGFRTAQLITWL